MIFFRNSIFGVQKSLRNWSHCLGSFLVNWLV
uniref:Uncharacterized protein n=1 Tax=Arundo donax TaxID=35708 RepID=A0A0A9BVJ0_ARUDO